MTLFSSKFFQILKTFSTAELKSFDFWLKSTWANSNKNLIRLLDKVHKYHPAFAHPKLTKEKLFKQILPNGKFSDRRMNNLLSEGYLAAERFMIFNNLSKNYNLQKDLLTQELQNRHLEDWFFRDVEKEIDRLETKPVKDWEDHLNLLRLHRRVYHHPNQSPRMKPGGQTIVEMGQQLDLVFLLEKAAIINEKIFRNRILKNENHDIEKELKIWLAASEEVEYTAIEFYRMRFGYEEETMLEQYFSLREAFLVRYEELNEKEQKIHLISLLNDTTLLVRQNRIRITETLPLYKLGLKTKIILYNGKITFNTYTTIVSASSQKKEFDFSLSFIKNYTLKLDYNLQKDARKWANATINFDKENYDGCLDILIEHKFQNFYFNLISRILTIKVYFNLLLIDDSYHSYLFNFFDSSEKWLQREKSRSNNFKKSFLRFIQICRLLAKLYLEANFNLDKTENILLEEKNLQAIEWLKNKRDEIIRKRKRRFA